MTKSIDNLATTVVIIDPVSKRLTRLIEAMKEIGYTNVTPAKSIQGALETIECSTAAPNWIITPLFPDENINGVNLLALAVKTPFLQKCRISLLLEPEEAPVLRNAFQMGLFSYHRKVGNIQKQIKDLHEAIVSSEKYSGSDPMISAQFLRKHLKKGRLYEDLVKLETNLLSVFPDDQVIKVRLASAMHMMGRANDAIMVLAHTGELVGEAKEAADKLRQRIKANRNDQKKSETFAEAQKIDNIFVIDPDDAVLTMMTEAAGQLGIQNVRCFEDGQVAWKALQGTGKIDLIVQEWRIPTLPGNILLNRIRTELNPTIPVVIHSSLVADDSDKLLLRELGVTDIIDKPQPTNDMAEILEALILQEAKPEDAKVAERRIRQLLKDGRVAHAQEVLDSNRPQFSPATHKSIQAEFAFHQNQFQLANEYAIESIQLGGEKLYTIDLLGKIYMKLRRFDQATKFFNKAKELSSGNLERLCNLAEAQAEVGDAKKAAESIAAAKELDGKSQKVKETEAKVTLASGDTNKTRRLIESLGDAKAVIAFMNNRAVALANQGQPQESLDLYHQAMQSLPEKQTDLKAIINYNLSLALVKTGNQRAAVRAIADSMSVKGTPVFTKASSLAKRVDRALKTGTTVKLISSTDPSSAEPEEHRVHEEATSLPFAVGIKRGDMRLHLIYECISGIDEMVRMLVQSIPTFDKGESSQPLSIDIDEPASIDVPSADEEDEDFLEEDLATG